MKSFYSNLFSTMERRCNSTPIGQLLVNMKVINPAELQHAITRQQNGDKGRLIGEILMDIGNVKEKHIAWALMTQYRFPYVPLDNYEINPEAAYLIQADIARFYNIIPVEIMGNILTIAVSNPLNYKAIRIVEVLSRCTVQIVVSTPSEIKRALNKFYDHNGNRRPSSFRFRKNERPKG
ncbi:MAG: hypothetical protein JW928_09785 [Candidatus Aureabacteria bacterium]|nr:hypothetical protein [Candidatus Auribacterota bacterium]